MKYNLNLEVLNLAMLNKGYSISKLSKKSGVSKSSISRLIKNTHESRIETIYKIAKALDIKSEDLLQKQ